MKWWVDQHVSSTGPHHPHHIPGSSALGLDVSKISWKSAIRTSMVPTALAIAAVVAGDPRIAVPLAMGALFVGVAEGGLPPGHRWKVMLWTTVWLMVSSGIGHAFAPLGLWALPGSALFAFLAGWVGSAGPRAALAGTLALVNFSIAQGLPEDLLNATEVVLLVGLGGFIQTVVMVIYVALRHPGALKEGLKSQPLLWRQLSSPTDTHDLFVRHGLRLMVVFTIATGISEFVPTQHQYWIPMSVAWMARPDSRGTASRIINRLVGTALGVSVLAVLGATVPYSDVGVLIVVAIGAYLMLAFVWANYAIAVLGVTMFVIALFDLNHDITDDTLLLRLGATALAAILVWLGTYLWRVKDASPGH